MISWISRKLEGRIVEHRYFLKEDVNIQIKILDANSTHSQLVERFFIFMSTAHCKRTLNGLKMTRERTFGKVVN